MTYELDTPINCRTAMLELNFDHNRMAEFLGLDRKRIVKMCVGGEDIPQRLTHKVRIHLNALRTPPLQRPMMELVHDLMWNVYRDGILHLDTAVQNFGLSGRQLKNIENVEGWIVIVNEPKKIYGRAGKHFFVYLTAAGHKELGKTMTIDTPRPSADARPAVHKHFDEVKNTLLDALDRQHAMHLEMADHIRSMKMLIVTGMGTVDNVVSMYDALTRDETLQPLQITHGNEKES